MEFGDLTKIIWRVGKSNFGELVFWRVDQHPFFFSCALVKLDMNKRVKRLLIIVCGQGRKVTYNSLLR